MKAVILATVFSTLAIASAAVMAENRTVTLWVSGMT